MSLGEDHFRGISQSGPDISNDISRRPSARAMVARFAGDPYQD
jgi:hypothetical protein